MKNKILVKFASRTMLLGAFVSLSTPLLGVKANADEIIYSTELQTSDKDVTIKTDETYLKLKKELEIANKEVETAKSTSNANETVLTDAKKRVEATNKSYIEAQQKEKEKLEELKGLGLTEKEIEASIKLLKSGNTTLINQSKAISDYKKLKDNTYRLSVNLSTANNTVKDAETNSSGSKTLVEKEIKEAQEIEKRAKAEEEKIKSRGTTKLTDGAKAYVVPEGYSIEKYINTSGYTSSTYPWGQCTWWVYNRAAEFGIKFDRFMGNGGDWDNHGNTYKVSNKPEVGDAITFAPGEQDAAAFYGHVGFVEEVKEDGTVLMSESNFKGLGTINYRVFSPEVAKTLTYVKGIKS